MRRRMPVIGLGAVVVPAIAVILAVLLVPRPPGRVQAFQPACWPTGGWLSAAPEEQGFDSRRLAEGLRGLARTQWTVTAAIN